MRLRTTTLAAAAIILLAIPLAACSGGTTVGPTPTSTSTPTATTPQSSVTLNGAGSTFANPLYTKWFAVYYGLTGVKVNYAAIGSGAGIQQITAGTVDFGASDGIMTDQQQAAAEAAGGPIMHIPMTSGAVAIIYNLPGISSGQLKLTPDVLAGIYLKNIKKWNDPAITAINPGLSLPSTDIAVVHRSDGSGTTFIFTNYLSKVSTDWATRVGNGTSVNWPGDIGGKGSDGVAAQVQQIPGAIGYDELAYATENDIPFALLQNKSGNYIAASLASAQKAAVGITLPDDMKVMITDSSNPDAYPIVGFTWILAFKNQKDLAKGQALAKVLWWGIHDGQQYTTSLQYVPLSADAVKKAEAEILSMNYNGQHLVAP